MQQIIDICLYTCCCNRERRHHLFIIPDYDSHLHHHHHHHHWQNISIRAAHIHMMRKEALCGIAAATASAVAFNRLDKEALRSGSANGAR